MHFSGFFRVKTYSKVDFGHTTLFFSGQSLLLCTTVLNDIYVYCVGEAMEIPMDFNMSALNATFSFTTINLHQGFVVFLDSVCQLYRTMIHAMTMCSYCSLMLCLVKEVFPQAIVHVKIVTYTWDGGSILITLIIWHSLLVLTSHEGGQQLEHHVIGEWWALYRLYIGLQRVVLWKSNSSYCSNGR